MSPIQIKRGGAGGPTAQSRVEYGGGGGHHSLSATSVGPAAASSFDAAMEASELEALLDHLYEVSARLSVFPGARLIEEYRAVLTELLRRASQGFRIKRDLRWRKTDRKMYVTIERAEAAMEELEEAFLYEGDRTKALALMEEIKGCLISLLM